MSEMLYKVLKPNGMGTHAYFQWPLPAVNDATPTDWVSVTGPLAQCSNGLHLTRQPAHWYEKGYRVFAAEVAEDASRTVYDERAQKCAVSKCRLLYELDDAALCGVGIIRDGFFRDVIDEGDYVVMEGGTLEAMRGGTLKAMWGGTLNAMWGGTLKAMWGGTLEAMEGGTLKAMEGGTLEAMRGGTLNAMRGGTLNAMWGGTLKAMWGGTLNATVSGRYTTVIWYGGEVSDNVRDFAVVIDRRNTSAPLAIIGGSS